MVSAFSYTHIAIFHYLHQFLVAAFYAHWTYYELLERLYIAPAAFPSPSQEQRESTSISDEHQRFVQFDENVEQRLLYTQPGISRDDLCRLMGTDRTSFSRIIREQSGTPNLNAYLNLKRMHYAVLLMQHPPHYSIEAIMQDCGYKSKVTFNRVFKEFYGQTPSEYRKGLADEKPLPN